jgi:hypothetical protein
VPERTAEKIRTEIAAERMRLQEDVAALKARLRSLVPFVAGGVAVAALLAAAILIAVRRIRARR